MKPMENNTTPPKELYVDMLAFEQGGICDYVTISHQTIDDIKYLSEQSVKEMLAEKEREIERLKKENEKDFTELAYKGLEVDMFKDGLDSANAVYFALTGYNYTPDLQELLDGCSQAGAIEIVDEPSGTKQNEDCGIFMDIYVDQCSVGDSGDSFAGEIYAKVNEIWLKIPYNC